MDYTEVIKYLQGLGTAQNRKIYMRHGADERVFGVSFADLNKLSKKIKKDHELAIKLWDSGNFDARNLAVKIADPDEFTKQDADVWVADVSNYAHASALGGLAALSPDAKHILQAWTSSKKEFVKDAGYSLLGAMLKNNPDSLDDNEVAGYLERIEHEIHDSPNWARYAMNWALIAIGGYKDTLADTAIKTANRIGTVVVDHGETNCKTPDAAPYIEKMRKRALSKKQSLNRNKTIEK